MMGRFTLSTPFSFHLERNGHYSHTRTTFLLTTTTTTQNWGKREYLFYTTKSTFGIMNCKKRNEGPDRESIPELPQSMKGALIVELPGQFYG